MPLMHGSERCHCGHKRDEHLQRSREKRRAVTTSWVDAESDPAPKIKLAGCLLCTCAAFSMKRGRTL
jgi:hypothetical protein